MAIMDVARPSVLVLGDSDVGLQVAQWLSSQGQHRIDVTLVTRGDKPGLDGQEWDTELTYAGALSRESSEELARRMAGPDNFLVTCYWPWILPASARVTR